MTVATEAGYSWVNGKYARLLHAGNQFAIDSITATDDSGSTADLVDNPLTRNRWVPFGTASAAAEASIRLDTVSALEATCMCIGAHNLGTTGTVIDFEHDSDGNDTWTVIGSHTPTDDSPIMFFFDPITSDRWRVTVTSDGLPSIGVIRIGDPLVFERPFYAGFTPGRMNRGTEVIGSLSRTGELMGRSIRRTVLSEMYNWDNLTEAWVRANLDGPTGVLQSMEINTAFIAWRPEIATQDTTYIMRASTTPPTSKGIRDLWQFSMSVEGYSYE